MTRQERTVDVLVVGGGPAGLGAGAELAASGAGRVEILEREPEAGGIPRHCFHAGFGSRSLRGGLTGPAYARACAAAAERSGATLRTGVAVTGWSGPLTLDTTAPTGLERITARAVVLATGARERPRSARLVPGSRPPGVLTTGELQQAVHLHHRRIGGRALVVGDESVSHAAADTLRAAGAEVVARVTDRPPSPLIPALLRARGGVPLLTGTTVTALLGRDRLTGVALRHDDGTTTTLACDTVVFTADWIPEHELARLGAITLDPGTKGPAYDPAYRTSRPGVFAAGNLLHGGERAAVAAAEGRDLAAPVMRHLARRPTEGEWPADRPVLALDAPLEWIAPNLIGPGAAPPPGGRFLLRTLRPLLSPLLLVRQDGRLLDRQRLLGPAPAHRSFTLRADWLERADPRGGTVRITAR